MNTPAMVPMIAVKRHMYDRQWREPGQPYEARTDMVATLEAVGFAKRDTEVKDGVEANDYRRRDMRAEK